MKKNILQTAIALLVVVSVTSFANAQTIRTVSAAKILFGTQQDVNLYRSSGGLLQTDNGLITGGGISVLSGGLSVVGPLTLPNGSVLNSYLQNSSVTVNTGTGLSGGGAVALGGTLTLVNTGILSITGSGAVNVTSGQNPTISLGVVGIANGGTGITTSPSVGQFLRDNGSGGWKAGAISVSDLPAGTGTVTNVTASNPLSVTNGSTTPNISLTGIVSVGNGGTGIMTSPSVGQFLRDDGSGGWKAGVITSSDIPSLSGSYINNSSSLQSGANFNISGNGTIGGNLKMTGGSILNSSTTGATPVSGGGTLFEWIPAKGAFRAGIIDASIAGSTTDWDDANIGLSSVAFGTDTKASGRFATAMGYATTANADQSTALGNGTLASGLNSTALGETTSATARDATAIGWNTTASGNNSFAMGNQSIASNSNAIAMGNFATASASGSVAIGGYVSTIGNTGSFIFGDASTTSVTSTTAFNQFMVRASGGTIFYSSTDLSTNVSFPAGGGLTVTGGNVQFSGALMPNAMAGSIGQVLTSQGAGAAPIWAVAGGLSHITESFKTASPYSTSSAGEQLLATDATATDITVALQPKGNGALQAQIANGGTSGGNIRGTNSVDWQMARANNLQVASGTYSVIGGGQLNTASGGWSTVGGGYQGNATGGQATIAGGDRNSATGVNSTVAGGTQNTASGGNSFVGGGSQNTAGGTNSWQVVAGGQNNQATNTYAVIGGGAANVASGTYTVIGGGDANTVSGNFSAIPGGTGMTISGTESFGFQSWNALGSHNMTIGASNTVVFGNNDLWLANNINQASAIKFFDKYNTSGAFPNTSKYVGFSAPDAVTTSTIWKLPVADGTIGQVLKTDGSGNLSWVANSAASGWSLTGNSGTTYGTNFIGTTDAVELMFKVNNQISGRIEYLTNLATSFGYQALNVNTGTSNTAMGYQALLFNTTGYYNTASGYHALRSNTTGYFNTASGNQALYSNTTGRFNTASGVNALFSNTTGDNNTATGYSTLYLNTTGIDNTIMGYSAGKGNTSGNSNSFFGSNSGVANTTGGNNTFSGGFAGSSNTTGSNNIALGYSADMADGLTNAASIGYRAYVGASNSLVLGSISGVNSATSNTNVGIGTTTPASTFSVADKFEVNSTGNIIKINNVSYSWPAATPNAATSGTNLGNGQMETTSGGTLTWRQTAVVSAALDFPNTLTQTSSDLTVTVTGAADGDLVTLGVPNTATNANSCYTAWVSAADTVTIRFNNYSTAAINPSSGTFKIKVIK